MKDTMRLTLWLRGNGCILLCHDPGRFRDDLHLLLPVLAYVLIILADVRWCPEFQDEWDPVHGYEWQERVYRGNEPLLACFEPVLLAQSYTEFLPARDFDVLFVVHK